MVEHEGQLRELADRLDRGGQLVRPDQQFVDQAGVLDRGQAVEHVRTDQPVRVRLVLGLVPDALQPAAGRVGLQAADPLAGVARGQVDPADYRHDAVHGVSQHQHLGCLVRIGDGLHQHRGVHRGPLQRGLQVGGPEVAAQRFHLDADDPRLVADVEIPQVVVGVDGHRTPPLAPEWARPGTSPALSKSDMLRHGSARSSIVSAPRLITRRIDV